MSLPYWKWMKICALGVVLAALVVGVGACARTPSPEASPVPPTPMPEGTPTAVSEATPTLAEGGDITIAYEGWYEPSVMDAQIDMGSDTGLFDSLMTDSLICRDPQTLEFKPWLATDWEVSEDGLTWTFHLRDDVKFQDGTPFNAEAVKVNLDRILAPETMSLEAAAKLGPVESVEVVDEYTVKITHEIPYAAFEDGLSGFMIPIWSPTALEEYGSEFDEHLTGTGPFIFKEYMPRDHFTVTRNPDYNSPPSCVDHTGPAYLDSITVKFVGEDAVLGGVVKAGDADIAQLPPAYISQYEDDPNYKVLAGYLPGTGLGMAMNIASPPLDDIRVRKAILYAVDRQTISDMLFAGTWRPSPGPLAPGTQCYWEDVETMYPYDPDRANAVLDEAGWTLSSETGLREKDGKSLILEWFSWLGPETGEAVAAQLEQVGIGLEIMSAAGNVQTDKVAVGDYQLMLERQRGVDPGILDMVWNSKNSGPGGWAWSNFQDERLDELLDRGNTELGGAGRCELYTEVQRIIMENALWLGLFDQARYWVVNDRVEGFEPGFSAWVWYPYDLRIVK